MCFRIFWVRHRSLRKLSECAGMIALTAHVTAHHEVRRRRTGMLVPHGETRCRPTAQIANLHFNQDMLEMQFLSRLICSARAQFAFRCQISLLRVEMRAISRCAPAFAGSNSRRQGAAPFCSLRSCRHTESNQRVNGMAIRFQFQIDSNCSTARRSIDLCIEAPAPGCNESSRR